MSGNVKYNQTLDALFHQLGVLEPAAGLKTLTDQSIGDALEHPFWDDETDAHSLVDRIQPGESLCLVVSDHTRQTAADRVIPILLELLQRHGCSAKDIEMVIATGIHRPPTASEIESILGIEIACRFAGRIHCHDADNDDGLVTVGYTAGRHSVRLNRRAVEAKRLILIGVAGYHYHAGYGGGRKSLVPGLADRATIAYTHSLTLDPESDQIHPCVQPGCLAGNPVAEALQACAGLHPPTAIINTVLDPAGRLVAVCAGSMTAAHRAACRMVEKFARIDLTQRADCVVASAAQATTWIQAHKALFNAARAVHEEGRIILEAPCIEGLGNERFRHWLKIGSLCELYRALRCSPEVNGQTALSTRLKAPRTLLVTRMPPDAIDALGMETAPDMQTALVRAHTILKRSSNVRPTVWSMPHAMHVVPFGP